MPVIARISWDRNNTRPVFFPKPGHIKPLRELPKKRRRNK